jgi:acetolactate synthase-1/2/3 large subunit
MMRTTADALAEAIAGAGTRHVFGISGGEVLVLMDALTRAGVRFIGTRHETAAGFMAEGTWHAQGTLGVMPGRDQWRERGGECAAGSGALARHHRGHR